MRKNLLLALLFVAFVAMPAFASVQNVKVSGDIDSTFLMRNNFDFDVPNGTNSRQSFFFTQSRLRVDADLTDKVSTVLGLINERVWTEEDSANSDLDVNLAFVQLKEFAGSNATLTIGRQVFQFGNSFVIDATGTNNSVSTGGLVGAAADFTKRTALDAVRATFDLNPLTIDVIGAKADSNNFASHGAHNDDVDLYGTNLNYRLGDERNSVLEGYFWVKSDKSVNSTGAGRKTDLVYMPGVHISTNPVEGLNTQFEFAVQGGTRDVAPGVNQRREAMAGEFIANYQVPAMTQYKPVAQFVYSYTSGDSDPSCLNSNCHTFNGWDPMLENQSGGKIYNSIFNLTDSHIIELSLQANPMEDVTAKLSWTSLWLDKQLPDSGGSRSITLVQPDGTSPSLSATKDKHLGNEIDANVSYAYTEDVMFGLGVGMYFPGDTFDGENDSVAKQVVGNVAVTF